MTNDQREHLAATIAIDQRGTAGERVAGETRDPPKARGRGVTLDTPPKK